jgi:acyl-CoA synthetase (AMP-forming)/AMP-acid ligase II
LPHATEQTNQSERVLLMHVSMCSGAYTCGITWNNVVGSVGLSAPGISTIIHNPNAEGIGEVSYLDLEQKTIDAFGGPDGKYFRTGDLGRRDLRGLIHVCGRIKG